jgi:hypothetical protein
MKPWGVEHSREAMIRAYEIGAELTRTDRGDAAYFMNGLAVRSEEGFRASLWRFDPARIDREVRRVRGLAEGRLVREPYVRIGQDYWTGTEEGARRHARMLDEPIVRGVRIRRAPST